MSDSILVSIKKLLGIEADYDAFDQDVLIAINSAFTILNQLGVGPEKAYYIRGDTETWSDFFGDEEFIELVKSYIYLRARLLFDPPSTGVLHEAIERQISEFEWRMTVQASWNRAKPQPPNEEDSPETDESGGEGDDDQGSSME